MPRLITIADANAYISLSDAQLDALVLRERSNGIVAWGSYFVVDELIARSASADPKRAMRGTTALRRLAKHCTMYDGSHQRVNFVADPRDQLGSVLFGSGRPGRKEAADLYGTVVYHIAADPHRSAWPVWVTDFAEDMRVRLEALERQFADSLWTNLVQALVPEATTWADVRSNRPQADQLAGEIASPNGYAMSARMIAEEIAAFVGATPTEERLAWATQTLMDLFPLSMRVYNALLHRIAARGIDASKGHVANTVWDMQLCMSLPVSSRASTTPLWLITGDELIQEAGRDAGAEHMVTRLADYLLLLGERDLLHERLQRFRDAANNASGSPLVPPKSIPTEHKTHSTTLDAPRESTV